MIFRGCLHSVLPAVAYLSEGNADCRVFCEQGKIIVGRNNFDNEKLRGLTTDDDLVLFMADFPGPYVVIPHGIAALLPLAASLCVRYSDAPADLETNVICQHKKSSKTIQARAAAKEDCARWII